MIVATAGHVDHGKTLLVHTLTGTDTDRLPEEKSRGLTIELGFAYHDLGDGRTTGFVDVPGHERFVRTMVAGVSGIDVVMLVIAADDGPMPQTAEHLAILDLLGVTRGVVALTKIDRVDEARVAAVTAECRALLAPTALAELPIVALSAMTGAGIDELRAELLALAHSVPPRTAAGGFRLAVDRSFLLKGAGRVVTGTVFAGAVAVDDTLAHIPAGGTLRVRGIHAQNQAAARAVAGQRCALNLAGAGLREGDLHRGDWVVDPQLAFTTRRLDVEVRVLASEARALRNRTPVHVHVGAADVTGRLVTFDGAAIPAGGSALGQLLLDRELHAVRGDRLVLRDQSAQRTLGGGTVINPLPVVRGHGRRERLAYLEAMRAGDAASALNAALAACPDGIEFAPFAQAWNLDASARRALLEAVAHVAMNQTSGLHVLSRTRWQTVRDQVVPALRRCHQAAPDRAGVSPADLARALPERVRASLFEALVDDLIAAGDIERQGGWLRVPGHAARRSAADEALWRRVERLLDVPDGKAPVVHDMLATLRLELKPVEAFLARSAQQGYLVRVSAKRYFLPHTVAGFEQVVLELAATRPGGTFTVADFRDRTGIGRNAVVEILEYFDRIGLTRRQGEVRKLIKAGAQPESR
ncbi:MAG: selenocysteine-specific translation elongation factor [Gammaproteobacteria bacterium]